MNCGCCADGRIGEAVAAASLKLLSRLSVAIFGCVSVPIAAAVDVVLLGLLVKADMRDESVDRCQVWLQLREYNAECTRYRVKV